ncbi:hypothetical protein C1H46_005635 [Malus baccata]|uniref:Uncharacterized protein n=1 Tax=Malus baccata TaxID=106549 RepID=A0A540NCM0_MALBA|nr:hypothetical protein C1H46_005635 [Malus baccata]
MNQHLMNSPEIKAHKVPKVKIEKAPSSSNTHKKKSNSFEIDKRLYETKEALTSNIADMGEQGPSKVVV